MDRKEETWTEGLKGETKLQYCSKQQKDALIDLVSEDQDLLSTKFSNAFTAKDGQKKWEQIAGKLNAIPGGSKDWKQWKKTWQDIKSKTKGKQASLNRHAKGTGGGPPKPELTASENKVINLLDPTVIEGIQSVNESCIEFIFADSPGTSLMSPVCNSNKELDFEQLQKKESETNINEFMLLKNENLKTPESDKRKFEDTTPRQSKRKNQNRILGKNKDPANVLADTSKERIMIQKEYYQKKLEILDRQALAIDKLVNFLISNAVTVKLEK